MSSNITLVGQKLSKAINSFPSKSELNSLSILVNDAKIKLDGSEDINIVNLVNALNTSLEQLSSIVSIMKTKIESQNQKVKQIQKEFKKVDDDFTTGFKSTEALATYLKKNNKNKEEKDNGVPPGSTGNPKGSKNSQGKLKMKTKLIHKIEPFPGVTSLLRDFIVIPDLRPTVNVRVQELKNLEKYLQSGDLTSAVKSYEFLKTFGGEKDDQDLLAKYGYKVEEKDGKYVISKIAEESSTTTTNTDTSSVNNNENDVVAEETVNATPEESPKENLSVNESNNQNQTENVVNTTTDNHNNSSSNNNNYSNSSNHSQSVVENTSTEVNNQENIQVDTDNASTGSTTIGGSMKESPKEETKTNVVSITDDNKTTTTKKSSGLGAAVPIGLGTIATGAAAVAGVRYVKNRHDHQEEYEDDYDDENNNLDDSNEEYVDSAQYDDGSSYMDDDYLGPVDNSDISTEDSYVDPGRIRRFKF